MSANDFEVAPDPRMQLFTGGMDPSGQFLPMSPAALRRSAEAWPISASTPDGIAGLLKTSRALYVQSYFAYEFLTLGVLVSLQAVETSLRLRLQAEREHFKRVIDRAHDDGIIDARTRELVDAGRELRNMFSHPAQQTVWTFGMAAPVIGVSHELIAGLFPDVTTPT